jgi:hypothetical protein
MSGPFSRVLQWSDLIVTLEIGLARQNKSKAWKFMIAPVEFEAEGRKHQLCTIELLIGHILQLQNEG